MSAYTAAITAQINLQYPNPPVSAGDQASLLVLGEAVAALVTPAFADERIVAIEATIDADPVFNQMPKNTQAYANLLIFCEFCLNLAIAANTPGGGTATPTLTYMAYLSQSGTGNPIVQFLPGGAPVNSFPVAPTFSRGFSGIYTATFATGTPFANAGRVEIIMGQGDTSRGTVVSATVVTDNTIQIETGTLDADILTGAITSTSADGILALTLFKVTVYSN